MKPLRARIDRRTAIRWMLTASSAALVPGLAPGAGSGRPPGPLGPAEPIAPLPARPGYGTDPDLVRAYQVGDYWPLTLTDPERVAVAALADLILPEDEVSPSASAVGVPDFIDEWVSAPYPAHAADRVLLLEGLRWLEAAAYERSGCTFAELSEPDQRAICDPICQPAAAAPERARAAAFFNRFRALVMGGYYTTPEGMRDLRYVGNLPSATFAGPPPEVLARLGLDQPYP